METITISKREYARLKEAEQKLGRFSRDRLAVSAPKQKGRLSTDQAFLKLAESSFAFWRNPDDAIYDNL